MTVGPLRVRTRLLLVLFATFVIAAALIVIAALALRRSDRGHRTALAWSEHAAVMVELRGAAERYLSGDLGGAGADAGAARAQAGAELDTLRQRSLALAGDFDEDEVREEAELSEALTALLRDGREPDVDRELLRRRFDHEVVPRLAERIDEERTGAARTAREGRTAARRLLVAAVVASVVLLLIVMLACLRLLRSMTRALAYLETEAQAIAGGDLTRTIELRSDDEFGRLARVLGQMVAGLRATMIRKSELAAEVARKTDALAGANDRLAASNHDLVASEARHRILFDLSPVPAWVADRDGRVVTVNDAAVALFGASRDELRGTTLAAVPAVPAGPASRPSAPVRERAATYRRRGDDRSVELDTYTHELEVDGQRRALTIALDVTGLRAMEEQLRQAQKLEAIGQLAGGVAHDFNNILMVVLGNAALVQGELGPEHACHGEVSEIVAAGERAAELTRQLLAFSRKQPRRAEAVSLNQIATALQRMLTRLIGETITLTCDLAPDLGAAMVDPGQLEQVLTNLVVNARDAMPSGGTITITTAERTLDPTRAAGLGLPAGRYVTIAVTDTGTGMEPATVARIFEPFFTTKEVGKGTGLGLATVFGIVRQSDGAVAVDSTVGRGSTFTVYLPRSDARADGPRPRPALAVGGRETVLVIEDDEAVRRATVRLVAALGYHVLEVDDPRAALQLLDRGEHDVALVLSDLVMPGMNGQQLAEEVARRHPHVKIVLMSGYARQDVGAPAPIDLPMIGKPFSRDTLGPVLRQALDGPAPAVRAKGTGARPIVNGA